MMIGQTIELLVSIILILGLFYGVIKTSEKT